MKCYKILIVFLISLASLNAFAQSSAELKRKKEAIQREIDQLQKNLNRTANNKKLTLQQINALNAKIRLQQNKIAVINSEIKSLDREISDNNNQVKNLQQQLGTLKKEYAAMIQFAQKNKNSYDKMMFIFAAQDFNQAYKRIKYLQQFSQYRKKQAGYIENTQKQLHQKITVLDKSVKEKSVLLQDQEKERSKLGKDKSAQSVTLNTYTKQERKFKQDIATRRKQQQQYDRLIANAIRKEIEAAKRKAEEDERRRIAAEAAKAKAENREAPVAAAESNKSTRDILTATPEAARMSAGFENNRGRLPWPVASGSITERFGSHMVDKAKMTNNGVNIVTNEGAAVRAVFDGEVLSVQTIYGKYVVIIRHGEYFTIYQNLRSVSVSTGSKVSTKQTIGTIATSGDVAELHFEIIRGMNNYQNPEAWISK